MGTDAFEIVCESSRTTKLPVSQPSAAFATFSVTGISKDDPGMTSNVEASVTAALLSLNERLIESVSGLSPVYLPVSE